MNTTTIQNLIRLLRPYEWIDKLELNIISAFIIIYLNPQISSAYRILFFLIVYMIVLGSYGYTINSYGDRKQDASVGKHPESSYFSTYQLRVVLIVLGTGSLALPFYFDNLNVRLIGIINFFLVTFYSLQPIRLKEKGILGIAAAILTQRPLPFLMFAFLVSVKNIPLSYFLFGWLSIIGISNMLVHQFSDFERDKKAKVNTFAQNLGKTKILKYIKFTLVLMMVYAFIPVFIIPFGEGLTVSLITVIFSGFPISYCIDSLRQQ